MNTPTGGPRILDLRRGGVLIHTSAGVVQYGVSPETIKDTMTLECGVPGIFLLPRNLFLEDLGLSVADLEFPIYYNFFVRGQKIRVICGEEERRRAEVVVREAIFGPPNLSSVKLDYPGGAADPAFPDLRRELEFFRRNPRTGRRMRLDDLVEFLVFDDRGEVSIGDLTVSRAEIDWYTFRDRGEEIAFVPSRIYILPQPSEASRRDDGFPAGFRPPRFGLTIIGSGHGFDPNEMTSGFLLWVNGHGILVDPPVETTSWLEARKIDPTRVSTIILTHCHADHDAGSLQKILDVGRTTVVTTRTILESFIAKYRALLDLPRARFLRLFDAHPVRIGEPINLFGATFRFRYTLHSIPTVMFSCEFAGKSFMYTADHMNDRAFFDRLLAEGVLTPGRHAELASFPWDRHDLILHEAGMPPIHTPMASLEALPPEVKSRIRLIHVSKNAVKPESGLALIGAGLNGTHDFGVAEPELAGALRLLEALSRIDLFGTLHISRAKEFLEIARVESFPEGATVIRKGTPGDKFYIVLEGLAGITLDGTHDLKRHGRHEYFGETAIILDRLRNADVVARTPLECLVIDRPDFLRFMRGTPIVEHLKRIAENRALDSWLLLEEAELFAELSGAKRTELLAILEPCAFKKDERLAAEGERATRVWLIDRGKVDVEEPGRAKRQAGRGDLVGFTPGRGRNGRYPATLRASTSVTAYRLKASEFAKFLDRNPGLMVVLDKYSR